MADSSAEVIVAAAAQTLYGLNRKGQKIFTLETNLVEPILFLYVSK